MSDLVLPSPPLAAPVRALLRVEGLAEFLVLLLLYARVGESWWLFLALFLAPDLGFLGYLAGPRVGAAVYNALHVLLAPALLGGGALLAGWPLGVAIALIWASHIQFDRALGYGLKYASGFGDTHLGRFGKAR
jgi:Domain of unknown function (DUF4260)